MQITFVGLYRVAIIITIYYMRVVVIRWDNITVVYKKFYPGHKCLKVLLQLNKSKRRTSENAERL